MFRDRRVHHAFEPVEIASPSGKVIGVAAPIRAAAFKTAVRDEILNPLGRDLGEPFAAFGVSTRDTSASQNVPVFR